MTHLYWAYRLSNGARLLGETAVCSSFCGQTHLDRSEVTLDPKKNNCPRCKELAATIPMEPEPPPKSEPSPQPRAAGPSAKVTRQSKWPWPPGAMIHILNPRNPQSKGSAKHARWAMVWSHKDKPWEAYRDAGGNPETLRNVVKDKYAEVK